MNMCNTSISTSTADLMSIILKAFNENLKISIWRHELNMVEICIPTVQNNTNDIHKHHIRYIKGSNTIICYYKDQI